MEDDIRKKYKEFCDLHINGFWEKLKQRLDEYDIRLENQEYRKLLLEKIEKINKKS